jgi:hypothetical protein
MDMNFNDINVIFVNEISRSLLTKLNPFIKLRHVQGLECTIIKIISVSTERVSHSQKKRGRLRDGFAQAAVLLRVLQLPPDFLVGRIRCGVVGVKV